MRLYLFFFIFFLFTCARHDSDRVRQGVLFVNYQGEYSPFSTLSVDFLSIEFIKKDGSSVVKRISKKVDWAFPYAHFLTGLSVDEGEYERIRVFLGFAETSALIYGATDTGEVFLHSLLDAQLVNIDGYLIPQEFDRQFIDIILDKPFLVSPFAPQFLSFRLSLDDSLTPVSTGESNRLLFLPALDMLLTGDMRLRGVVDQYANNQLIVNTGEALINIDNPTWFVNGILAGGRGVASEIEGANIEVEVTVDASGRVSYQRVDLISQEKYIGHMMPNKEAVSFSGHGVSVGGQISFVENILFPELSTLKEGMFDMRGLPFGQALSFFIDNSSGELSAGRVALLSSDLVAKIIKADENQLLLRPISIDKKLGGAFYQHNIITDNKYFGAIQRNDIVKFTGVFKGGEPDRFEVIEHQVLDRVDDKSFEKKISIKFFLGRKHGVDLSGLINDEYGIYLSVLSGKAIAYATETNSSVLVDVEIESIDTSIIDVYKVILEKDLELIERVFHSFENFKEFVFSLEDRCLMFQVVLEGEYIKSTYQAKSIVLYAKAIADEESINTQVSLEEESQDELSKAGGESAVDSSLAIKIITSSLIGISIVGIGALGARIYFDYEEGRGDASGVDEPISKIPDDGEFFEGGEAGKGVSGTPTFVNKYTPEEPDSSPDTSGGSQKGKVDVIEPARSFTVVSSVGVKRDALAAIKVDENGGSFYVKPQDRSLAMDEKLASELYKIVGVDIAEHKIKKLGLDEKRQLETSAEYAVYTEYEGEAVNDIGLNQKGSSLFQSKVFDLVVADLWLGNKDMLSSERKISLDKKNSIVKILGLDGDMFRLTDKQLNLALHKEDFSENLASHGLKGMGFDGSKLMPSLMRLSAVSLVDIKGVVNQYFSGSEKIKSYLSDLLIYRKINLLFKYHVGINNIKKEDAAVYFMFRYGKKIRSSVNNFIGHEEVLYDNHNDFIKGYIDSRKESDLDILKNVYGEYFLLRCYEMPLFHKEIISKNLFEWISNDEINVSHVSSWRVRVALDGYGDRKKPITDYFSGKYGRGFKKMLHVFSLDDVDLFNEYESVIYDKLPSMGDLNLFKKNIAIGNFILNKYKSNPRLIANHLSERERIAIRKHGVDMSTLINESSRALAVDNLSVNVDDKYLFVYSDVAPKDIFKFGFSVSGEYEAGVEGKKNQGDVFYPRFSRDVGNHKKDYVYLVRKPVGIDEISVADFKSYGGQGEYEAVRYFLKPIKKGDIIAATKDIETVKNNAAAAAYRFYEADWYNNPDYKVKSPAYGRRKN